MAHQKSEQAGHSERNCLRDKLFDVRTVLRSGAPFLERPAAKETNVRDRVIHPALG